MRQIDVMALERSAQVVIKYIIFLKNNHNNNILYSFVCVCPFGNDMVQHKFTIIILYILYNKNKNM